jgi:hypothetical protein
MLLFPNPRFSKALMLKINVLCFHIKNEAGMRYSKDNLDPEKRKESDKAGSDKSGAHLSSQVS